MSAETTFAAETEVRYEDLLSPGLMKAADLVLLLDKNIGVLAASLRTVEEIAKEYTGKLKVVKLNVDENINAAGKFNIRGIPTLILFKNGTVEAQKVGAVTKSQLAAFLDSNL